MPIMTTKPVADPAGDYNCLGINLSISPVWQTNNIGASVSMALTPFRVREGIIEPLMDQQRYCVFGDAFQQSQTDPALTEAVSTIMTALQQFVTAKGL